MALFTAKGRAALLFGWNRAWRRSQFGLHLLERRCQVPVGWQLASPFSMPVPSVPQEAPCLVTALPHWQSHLIPGTEAKEKSTSIHTGWHRNAPALVGGHGETQQKAHLAPSHRYKPHLHFIYLYTG